MELVSEKIFNLHRREDELKKEIELNNKKIDYLNEKLTVLLKEKDSIDLYFKCGKIVDLLVVLTGSGIEDLIPSLPEAKRKKVLKERICTIDKQMLVITKTKKNLKNETINLEEELININKEIKEL